MTSHHFNPPLGPFPLTLSTKPFSSSPCSPSFSICFLPFAICFTMRQNQNTYSRYNKLTVMAERVIEAISRGVGCCQLRLISSNRLQIANGYRHTLRVKKLMKKHQLTIKCLVDSFYSIAMRYPPNTDESSPTAIKAAIFGAE